MQNLNYYFCSYWNAYPNIFL